MNKAFQFEDEAFDLLIRLEQGVISQSDVIDWADKKLGSIEYDDEIANISLLGNASVDKLKTQLIDLISNYPEKRLKYDAARVAEGLINSRINTIDDKANFILSCRKLSGFVNELGLGRKFLSFWIVDDDAEGFPLNNERFRTQWNKDALKKKDEELDSIIDFYLPDVVEECRKLINEIEPEHSPYRLLRRAQGDA